MARTWCRRARTSHSSRGGWRPWSGRSSARRPSSRRARPASAGSGRSASARRPTLASLSDAPRRTSGSRQPQSGPPPARRLTQPTCWSSSSRCGDSAIRPGASRSASPGRHPTSLRSCTGYVSLLGPTRNSQEFLMHHLAAIRSERCCGARGRQQRRRTGLRPPWTPKLPQPPRLPAVPAAPAEQVAATRTTQEAMVVRSRQLRHDPAALLRPTRMVTSGNRPALLLRSPPAGTSLTRTTRSSTPSPRPSGVPKAGIRTWTASSTAPPRSCHPPPRPWRARRLPPPAPAPTWTSSAF
mmetsp:Transcript_3250/g.10214  ORF Transcript_3250/g.10214 Transcript_3250/m.10214 type:complete len:297 (-) Transcript_3250:128-1018(-)